MSQSPWTRHDDEPIATDRILDAAGQCFADLGVATATMTQIARAAGCSRATLYRYFPNRESLRFAFVHRATLRIAARLEAIHRGPSADDLVERIVAGIGAVRTDPMLAIWFTPENMAVPVALSQNSDVLRALSVGLVGELGATIDPDEVERRGEWLLRCIISLLAMPGIDANHERQLIESFVVPVVLAATDAELTTRGTTS